MRFARRKVQFYNNSLYMRWTLAIAILSLLAVSNTAHSTQTEIVTPRIDIEKLKELQRSVDEGHQPWWLDPMMVACSEMAFPEDTRTCWSESSVEMPSRTQTVVTFHASSGHYIVYLERLVRPDGIWTAMRIETTPAYPTSEPFPGPAEIKAMEIAENHIAANFKGFTVRRNDRPKLLDKGDYWLFYYASQGMIGGSPTVEIDKQSFKVIRSYMTQ